jgi:cyclopropane fatty-acyl-phospholipid synthase-like methyltransferase
MTLSLTRSARPAGSLLVFLLTALPAMAQHHHSEMKHNPDGMKHSFEDAQRWSAIFDAEDRDSWQKPQEVVEQMAIEPGMTVADLGAGTGYFLARLAHAVGDRGKVLGLDVEPAMVEFINRRGAEQGWTNVEARLIPGDDPGLAPDSVDRVLIVNTWHHLGSRPAYSRRLGESLRAGGAIFVVDYTLESPDGPAKEYRLPPEQIVQELQAGGLRAEILDEDLPHQFVVRAVRP